MSRRRQNISTMRTRGSVSDDSVRSDNLHVSLSMSPSNFQNIVRPSVSRKEKFVPKKNTKKIAVIAKSKPSPRIDPPTSGIPEDVAVHFGKFYKLDEESKKTGTNCPDRRINKSKFPARTEFTGQMVHKLERLAGTEYYARQISALLDETVESPNFAEAKNFCCIGKSLKFSSKLTFGWNNVQVKPPPADNFVLYGPYETYESMAYPLWYKEPDKWPSCTGEYSISTKHQTMRENERAEEMQSNEFAMSAATGDSRQFADDTDYENNDESSSSASSDEQSIVPDENTEES